MAVKLIEVSGVLDCVIVRRLNRFVVEVVVGGQLAKAYINNTGRLLEYLVEGREAYCIKNPRARKTGYRLFAVSDQGLGALIDTQMQMKVFEKAIEIDVIPWLRGYRILRRNARLGNSVIDYLMEYMGSYIYVEVKSAVLRGDNYYAMYPDCPTLRGRRHINEIINHVLGGGLGAIVFIAALPNVKAFKPYVEGDPVISELLKKADEVGVLIKAISLYYNPRDSAIYLGSPELRVELE